MTLVGLPGRVANHLRARARTHVHAVRLRRLERRLAAPRLLRAFADEHPTATFVEIGSNDGEQHDHLRPFILSLPWTGVMVEPVPYVFERLQRNYGAIERVVLENAAISAGQDDIVAFYHLIDARADERKRLPDWYDGIGSLSKETVLAHAVHIPDIAERLVTAQVPALTFESLCERHGLDRVDLLVIDTEGYDWEIVRRVDFAVRRPKLLIYEHFHLAAKDRADAAAYLKRLDYALMEEGFDTFCVDCLGSPRLAATLSRLRPAVPGVSVHDEAR